MNKTLARKYLTSINSNKRKYVTCEDLSISFGKFPESIASDLSVFEPLIILDMSLNLKDLVPAIEKYIEEENNKNDNKNKQIIRVYQKDINAFDSIADFVYQKMTYGGTLDRYATLSDKDLKTLKKLISEEQARRKQKK